MSLFKKLFNSEKKEFKSNDEKVLPKFNANEFNINDFEEKYKDKPFYIHEYSRNDGEWIKKGEKILIIRINEVVSFRFMSVSIRAEKSGILEWTLDENQLLTNGIIMYKLHEKGVYENENSPDKEEFKHFFYVDEPKHTFDKWLKSDGDFVTKGEAVYTVITYYPNTYTHIAEKDGYIHIIEPKKSYRVEKNELLYYIRDSDEKRIEQKFINEPDIIKDEFNNSINIKWKKVSSEFPVSNGVISKSDNYITDLIISFIYFQDSDFILFTFNPKQIKPKRDDKICLLFDNNKQLEFELKNNPVSAKNRLNERILEYKTKITKSELELFANINFKKWKISLVNDKREILGGEIGGDKNYESKNCLNIVIKKYAREYIELVNDIIPNYEPLKIRLSSENSNTDIKSKACYVYLMLDTSNGYYKIGVSNKPNYREKTLQSEKPTIEMIASKKYPVRKIAESFEKSLHSTYSDKRVRGEWFELDEIDVFHIKESLK